MRFDQIQISHKYGIGNLEMENKLEYTILVLSRDGAFVPHF